MKKTRGMFALDMVQNGFALPGYALFRGKDFVAFTLTRSKKTKGYTQYKAVVQLLAPSLPTLEK